MNLSDFFLPLYDVEHIDPRAPEVETGDQEFKANLSCTVSSKISIGHMRLCLWESGDDESQSWGRGDSRGALERCGRCTSGSS